MKHSPQATRGKPITLDEEIIILNWDKSNLSEEKMIILGELFAMKAKEAKLRREHQKRQVLDDIKDFFLHTVVVDKLDDNAPNTEKLIKIVEKVNNPDVEIQENFVQREERKHDKRVMENISSEIVIKQVELYTLIIEIE